MARKIITAKSGRKYERVSRWIRIDHKEVTEKSRLYDYSDCMEYYVGEKGGVNYFRHNDREYAIGQFMRLYYPEVFENEDGKESCLSGYDCEEYYYPLLVELHDNGEYVRLYREVSKDEM